MTNLKLNVFSEFWALSKSFWKLHYFSFFSHWVKCSRLASTSSLIYHWRIQAFLVKPLMNWAQFLIYVFTLGYFKKIIGIDSIKSKMTPPPTIPTMTRHKNTKKVYLKGRLFRLHKCAEHVLSNKYFVCTILLEVLPSTGKFL